MKASKLHRTLATGLLLLLTLLAVAPRARAQIFVSSNDNTIWQFTSAGVGTLFANTGLNNPRGLAFDNLGRLYVANRGDQTITRFDTNGTPFLFAGIPFDFTQGLNEPVGLAFDSASSTLFVANRNGNTIGKYSTLGNSFQTMTVFVSTGLNRPFALAINNGKLYVASDADSTIVTFQIGGNGTPTPFTTAGLSTPFGLAFDSTGALYAANQGNSTISKIDNGGTATLFAATAQAPVGLAFDAAGGLLVAENGQTIQKFTGNVGAIFNTSIQPQFIAVRCEPATINIALYAGLNIQGSIGCQYRIDYTTFLNSDPSLTVWTPLTTLTLATSPFLFVDTTAVSGSRFYRAVALP